MEMNNNISSLDGNAPSSESLSNGIQQDNNSLSENDISDILQDNGFSGSSSEESADADIVDTDLQELNESLDDFLTPTSPSEESVDDSSENPSLQESDTEETDSASPSKKIPYNSPAILVNDAVSRFSGAEWFDEIQKSRVIIAGVGGIGSNVAFQIARMNPACITLYDNDNVERVNMAGQLYSRDDVGKTKVDAIADMIFSYTTARQVFAIKDRFTARTETGNIMICGFDNMMARSIFLSSWKRHIKDKSDEEKAKCLYIDGRLSMDTLQILCIRGDDSYNIDRYEREFLFSDSQADPTVCSMKQTTYLACMIGSLIVNLFTNFIANTLNPVIPYDLPFFTEYDAQNMIFKTEN